MEGEKKEGVYKIEGKTCSATRVKALAIRQAEKGGAGQAWGEFIREMRLEGKLEVDEEREEWESQAEQSSREMGNKRKGLKDLRGSRCQKRSSTIRGTSTTRKELLGEVRAAVSELIYPTEKHWLRERDELFEREIERKHDIIINKAMRGPRWEIVEEDVEETEKYYAKAARDRTRAGPTGVMGGMITLGGNQMREAMGLKLEMIASCGKRPAHWREAIMILALKPERPEQNIRGSYRPITVQEIPAKGVEAALARYYDELLRANPLHPMVMAYRENMSIGIALFAMTETCLHAQESKRRVVMIFTDQEFLQYSVEKAGGSCGNW